MAGSDPTSRLQTGELLRHARRPEWGTGSIVKIESSAVHGQPVQRLSVRFPNIGIKVLTWPHADLERCSAIAPGTAANGQDQDAGLEQWSNIDDSDWLGPLAKRKVVEVMVRLPERARDPFDSLRSRLSATAELYRFEREGRSLIEWAIAQSGLVDPLSRFTRHELEQLFDRWADERASHFRRLLGEAKREPVMVREVIVNAPLSARNAVKQVTASR